MGNEDKIKDLSESGKLQFLPAEWSFDETAPVIYSLEDEFAKTKKNRHFFLYVLVLGFISFLVFGTYVLTTKAQREQKDSDIRITEFEDLKLRELLDTAKNQEKKIERAKEEYRLVLSGRSAWVRRINWPRARVLEWVEAFHRALALSVER